MRRIRLPLQLLVFGACSMGYQMVLVKALTPSYGGSLHTWAITITGSLLAYSAGSFLGAFAAGRRSMWRPVILATAIAFLAATVFQQPVIGVFAQLPFFVGLVATVSLLGVLPAVLFSALVPMLLQNVNASPAHQAAAFGYVGAGNIIGTLATVFVLLPACGLHLTTALFGACIVLLCGSWQVSVLGARSALAALSVLSFATFGFVGDPPNTVFSRYDAFGWVGVVDSDGFRFLVHRTAGARSVESVINLSAPAEPIGYPKVLFPILSGERPPTTALQIGLGAGVMNHYLAARFPLCDLLSVDVNPTMLEVAKDYFHIPSPANHKVVVDDARHFLNGSRQRFDWIILDAFLGEYPPEHLRTLEFYTLIRDHLAPGGLLLVNFVTLRSDHDRDLASLRGVFPFIYQKSVNGSQKVLVCSSVPLLSTSTHPGVSLVADSQAKPYVDNFSIRQAL